LALRIRGKDGAVCPQIITATRALDLDDIGAEVAEDLSAPRGGDDAAEVQNANALH
jgi:hypothetical protein